MDERFETIQQQLEALGAEPNEGHVDTAASESEAEEEGEEAAESHPELHGIKGLGSTYKQRLEDAGIESVEYLAAKKSRRGCRRRERSSETSDRVDSSKRRHSSQKESKKHQPERTG